LFAYHSSVATKTITLEMDAYEKLKRAKRGPGESFSSVVRRARWDGALGAGDLLGALREVRRLHRDSFLDDNALDRIEERASSRRQ